MNTALCMFIVVICLTVPFNAYADKVGGGDLTFRPKNAPSVMFSHEKHVNESSLNCSRCHYSIFPMMHGTSKMDMIKIRAGEYCGKCHNGKLAFGANHEEKSCTRCHK